MGHTNAHPAIELQLPTIEDPDLVELLVSRLDDFQITAIEERAPGALRVFFSSSATRDAASIAIVSEFASRGVSGRSVDVDDENWAARSQAELHAIQVGRIVVTPPWEKGVGSLFGRNNNEKTPDPFFIVIEPSMGFGTGHHESTRLCLTALQALDMKGGHVLDIGTGSGVLAIAAYLLGATHVTAVDVDPDALQSARENARHNRVESHIVFKQADFRDAPLTPAEIVLANLTGGIVNQSFDRLVDLTAPDGTLLVAGFTRDELVARPDGAASTSPRVEVVHQFDEEAWRCFVLHKKK